MSLSTLADHSRQTPRLSDVLFREPGRSFATIAALPSNVQAVEAALLFSTGAQPFLALVGPSGWGKSHLLEAVSCRIGIDAGVPPPVHSAVEWICLGARADTPGALILDNVQDALEGPRTRLLLRIALERRVRGHRPTILSFTAPKPTRQIKTLLPNLREWTIGIMPAPDPVERALVIDQMASAEGLHLSQVVVRLMAGRMKGNGRTLAGALKRLKLLGSVWTDGRQILRACGALDPFFADNSSWDLGERIMKAAEGEELQGTEIQSRDLAVHTMLRVAGLSEANVSRSVSVQPAEVYMIAARCQALADQNDSTKRLMNRFVERLVEDLAND